MAEDHKCNTCGTVMGEQLFDSITGVSVYWCRWCGTLRVGSDMNRERWYWKYPEAD